MQNGRRAIEWDFVCVYKCISHFYSDSNAIWLSEEMRVKQICITAMWTLVQIITGKEGTDNAYAMPA